MERVEWLKQMRDKVETLYNHLSPQYWVKFGLYANETHREYLQKFLGRLPPRSTLLSAACGAGRYDGMLLEAGHSVVGIDVSAGMLAQVLARHLRIPGIVLLLATGVVLGPEALDLVRPHALGGALEALVGFAVAIILFEGAMSLKFRRLARERGTIRRLVTVGAAVTANGGTLCARWILGWDWASSLLFGTLVIDDPTRVVYGLDTMPDEKDEDILFQLKSPFDSSIKTLAQRQADAENK